MGESAAGVTLSSCTSLPVAMPAKPIWPGRVFHADQAGRLLEGQRPGGHLRADQQLERARLRRIQGHAQLALVRVKSPEGDQAGRVALLVAGPSHR